jgi:hypothetical protein
VSLVLGDFREFFGVPRCAIIIHRAVESEHLRLEATDPVAGAAVAGDLLVDIADQAELQLLDHEL